MPFGKSSRVVEGIGEFFPEILGKPLGNPFIVIENLTDLHLNC